MFVVTRGLGASSADLSIIAERAFCCDELLLKAIFDLRIKRRSAIVIIQLVTDVVIT